MSKKSRSSSASSSSSNSVTPTTEPEMPVQVKAHLKKFQYEPVGFLCNGSTSSVFKLSDKNGNFLAAKVIHLRKLSAFLSSLVDNELKIFPMLQHPYIVRVEKVVTLTDYAVIVTEFANQGDLITHIEANKEPNIALVKRWFSEVTQALIYLHSKGIAHRDIKADNILLCNGTAKLADFGYATNCLDNKGQVILSKTFCGTLEYKAPETILCDKPYNALISDCYSLGVLLYVLVTHQFPFGSGEEIRTTTGMPALYHDIVNKKWQPEEAIQKQFPLHSLLSQLLNPDIRERITAAQAFAHPWFADSKNK